MPVRVVHCVLYQRNRSRVSQLRCHYQSAPAPLPWQNKGCGPRPVTDVTYVPPADVRQYRCSRSVRACRQRRQTRDGSFSIHIAFANPLLRQVDRCTHRSRFFVLDHQLHCSTLWSLDHPFQLGFVCSRCRIRPETHQRMFVRSPFKLPRDFA